MWVNLYDMLGVRTLIIALCKQLVYEQEKYKGVIIKKVSWVPFHHNCLLMSCHKKIDEPFSYNLSHIIDYSILFKVKMHLSLS